MNANVTTKWASPELQAEHEAIMAEKAALIAKYSQPVAYNTEMCRLHDLLRKYSHRWAVYVNGVRQEPSQRMYEWVDRYNTLAESRNFEAWCEGHGYAYPHDAYDVLS